MFRVLCPASQPLAIPTGSWLPAENERSKKLYLRFQSSTRSYTRNVECHSAGIICSLRLLPLPRCTQAPLRPQSGFLKCEELYKKTGVHQARQSFTYHFQLLHLKSTFFPKSLSTESKNSGRSRAPSRPDRG